MPFLQNTRDRVRTSLAICKDCEHYIELSRQCKKCGCFLPAKAMVRGYKCPIGKWPEL